MERRIHAGHRHAGTERAIVGCVSSAAAGPSSSPGPALTPRLAAIEIKLADLA
jgi:hypothetical protein